MKTKKKRDRTVIIGIAGPSGSGKTTLAKKLKNHLKASNCLIISMDNYYKDLGHLSKKEKEKYNYDHPSAIDFEELNKDLKLLKEIGTIEMPIYDFKIHERLKKRVKVKAKKIIIIEGILLYVNKELNNLIDFKIFLDIPLDICLLRRIKRDVNERNRTFESVYTQYLDTVRPMYFKFVEKTKKISNLVLKNNVNDLSTILNSLKSYI